METATILLDNGDKVNRFVTAMSKYRCPIHLTTKSVTRLQSLNRYFGMDLTKPLSVKLERQPPSGTGANRCGVLQDLEEFAVSRRIIIGRSIRLPHC